MPNKVYDFLIRVRVKLIYLAIASGALLIAGCAGGVSGAGSSGKTTNFSPENLEQPFGEYLAGQHARANMDLNVATDYYLQVLEQDKDNLSVMRRTYSLAIADGRYDQALTIARRLEELETSDNLVKLLLFLEKVKKRKFDQALERIDQIGSSGVYGLFKPLFKAWIYAETEQTAEAETVLTTLLSNESFRNFKRYHAALIYNKMGNTDQAEKLLSLALTQTDAITLRAVEAYGLLLRKIGRSQDARQLYLNYLEKTSENEMLASALADLDNDQEIPPYIQNVDQGLAEIFYTAATFLMQDNIRTPATLYLRYAKYLENDLPYADYLLGQIFELDDYYQGAVASFDDIPADHLLYYSAQVQKAWLLDKNNDKEAAIAALKNVIALFPGRRETYGALGDMYRSHGRFGDAVGAYTQAIEALREEGRHEEDKFWSLYFTRGIVLEREKRWPEAEQDFKTALKLRPDQPQVLNYLAYTWVDMGMRYEEARKMLEKAVSLRPHDGYIVDSLGWALYKMGDYAGAVENLEKAVLLQTDDWAINDHLGDAYWVVGRKNEARFQWRHALSLNPDEDKVDLIKEKIKNGLQK